MGNELKAGDLCVCDTGRIYRVLAEQYRTGGDFLRVCWVRSVRGRWVYDESDVHGQYASCVVKVTPEELEELAHRRREDQRARLRQLFREQWQRRSANGHVERGRTRSTCFTHARHGSHDWDKGDVRLWCPGTDGSNPQVPAALQKQLRELYGRTEADG